MSSKKKAARKTNTQENTSAAGPLPDDEGLSSTASADSESVDELVEEGNAFEAGVVSGVEQADETDAEVRTKEVPEDDVPEEYLDDKP